MSTFSHRFNPNSLSRLTPHLIQSLTTGASPALGTLYLQDLQRAHVLFSNSDAPNDSLLRVSLKDQSGDRTSRGYYLSNIPKDLAVFLEKVFSKFERAKELSDKKYHPDLEDNFYKNLLKQIEYFNKKHTSNFALHRMAERRSSSSSSTSSFYVRSRLLSSYQEFCNGTLRFKTRAKFSDPLETKDLTRHMTCTVVNRPAALSATIQFFRGAKRTRTINMDLPVVLPEDRQCFNLTCNKAIEIYTLHGTLATKRFLKLDGSDQSLLHKIDASLLDSNSLYKILMQQRSVSTKEEAKEKKNSKAYEGLPKKQVSSKINNRHSQVKAKEKFEHESGAIVRRLDDKNNIFEIQRSNDPLSLRLIVYKAGKFYGNFLPFMRTKKIESIWQRLQSGYQDDWAQAFKEMKSAGLQVRISQVDSHNQILTDSTNYANKKFSSKMRCFRTAALTHDGILSANIPDAQAIFTETLNGRELFKVKLFADKMRGKVLDVHSVYFSYDDNNEGKIFINENNRQIIYTMPPTYEPEHRLRTYLKTLAISPEHLVEKLIADRHDANYREDHVFNSSHALELKTDQFTDSLDVYAEMSNVFLKALYDTIDVYEGLNSSIKKKVEAERTEVEDFETGSTIYRHRVRVEDSLGRVELEFNLLSKGLCEISVCKIPHPSQKIAYPFQADSLDKVIEVFDRSLSLLATLSTGEPPYSAADAFRLLQRELGQLSRAY